MKQKPKNYWNEDTCREEAKKYSSRAEFKKKSNEAYGIALKNKWLGDYTWLKGKHPNGYWDNYEHCYEEAKKYQTKHEFKNSPYNRAYVKAQANGWLKDYIWLENKCFELYKDKIDSVYVYEFKEQNAAYIGRTLIKLQKQRDRQHIFSVDSVSSFAKEHDIAVPEMKILETNLTIREGAEKEGEWLEKYKQDGWLIINKAKTGSLGSLGKGKWNKKTCYEEAKKYKTRREFSKLGGGAYDVAKKNKWLDNYTWLKYINKPRGYWNYEKCKEEAKKYTKLIDFRNNSNSAYGIALKNKWLDDYTWLERIQNKQKPSGYWTQEHCYEEAKKYQTLNEFYKNSNGAYDVAKKNKWLDNYTWLKYINKPRGYWNYEKCKEEAKKYSTRNKFNHGCNSAYVTAWRNHWLDEFFPKSAPNNPPTS